MITRIVDVNVMSLTIIIIIVPAIYLGIRKLTGNIMINKLSLVRFTILI
ncbi:hypothetical protein SPD48_11045 [Pseudogracilibacillus sp. SE30717A]